MRGDREKMDSYLPMISGVAPTKPDTLN
jgi:hypothetical protein